MKRSQRTRQSPGKVTVAGKRGPKPKTGPKKAIKKAAPKKTARRSQRSPARVQSNDSDSEVSIIFSLLLLFSYFYL